MRFDTPLRDEHRHFAAADASRRAERAREARGATVSRAEVEVEYLPFGPADADGSPTCEIPAAFAEVELEYAAIRSGVAIVDLAHRATVVVRGADRVDFVNRLVTNDLRRAAEGSVVRAFLTNRKGRIDADLVVGIGADRLVIETLAHDAGAVREALERLVFSEDVVVGSRAETHHSIGLHGPKAAAALRALGLGAPDGRAAWTAPLGEAEADILRSDELGVEGYAISVPRAQAPSLWRSLVTYGARPAGWFAVNTARIEAGTPAFRIDFGPNNLPHETGVLDSRVSFTKGCYPGQEVVARMQNLGKPKQRLVGLRIDGDLLPVADAQVFAFVEGGSIGEPVGVVTSSGLAPMLGAVPVAFAMLASSAYAEGTRVLVNAEGEQAAATVAPLAFLAQAGAADAAGGAS